MKCALLILIISTAFINFLHAENKALKKKTIVQIRFNDGRLETGTVTRRSGNLQILETPLRKIWFNKNSIETIIPLEENDPPVIYRRLPEGADSRKSLEAVVHDLKWGQWNPDGSINFKCRDPKLGIIEDTFETKRFSAKLCYQDGRTYKWPLAFNSGLMWRFFNELPEPKTFQEKLDRVKFLRQGDRFDVAQNQLSLIQLSSEKEKELLKKESDRIRDAKNNIASVEKLCLEGLKPYEDTSDISSFPTQTFELLSNWWLQGALSTEVQALSKTLESHNISKEMWPKIIQSLPLPESEITPGTAQVRQWNWEGQTREYSIYLPKNYTPKKRYSCVIALHGQTGNDEEYIQNFLTSAERFNMIILSVEYVYDRKWGYYYHRKDMEAITGALQDARWRFSIDSDRVYLHGHSQGGHTCFDVTQSFINEFAASSPYIGAPFQTEVQLAHQKNFPMYIVGGEFDADAPKFCRKAITKLLKLNSPSVYVEYKKRGHEGFGEEYNNMWLFFAQSRRQLWPLKTESYWARNGEGARHWLRLIPGTINNEEIRAKSKSSLLKISGSWKKNRIKIKADKRLKEFEVLVPKTYTPIKKPLQIFVNGKVAFKEHISGFNLDDYLTEISINKDRQTPIRQVLKIVIPSKK